MNGEAFALSTSLFFCIGCYLSRMFVKEKFCLAAYLLVFIETHSFFCFVLFLEIFCFFCVTTLYGRPHALYLVKFIKMMKEM